MPGTEDFANKVEIAHRFFLGTGSTYDLTVHLWTLGLDRWWKTRILDKVPSGPRRILDQACGTGILTFLMARKFPCCEIVGVDLHREYLSEAMRKARAMSITNVQFVQGLAEEVSLRGPFDCITSSYLAKYARLDRLVAGARRMLRPGGILIMHDFTYPRSRFVSRILGSYFRLMQTLGSPAFPQWKNVFSELEGFLRQTRWVTELVDSLVANAFKAIRVRSITLGLGTLVYAANTSPPGRVGMA